MFEEIYNSPWHHPVLFWAATAVFLSVIAPRLGFLFGFLVWFAFEIAADALLTGAYSPIAASGWMTPVAILFVILGDLRFFLLLEWYARAVANPPARPGPAPRDSAARIFGVAVGWSLIVPVISSIPGRIWPAAYANSRVTFLTYELMFLVLGVVLRFWLVPRRLPPGRIRTWLEAVALFEVVQYGAWALSDVIILTGHDAGFALRFVANTMYYALFLPFVWWTAPEEIRPCREVRVQR